jgi:hypothetical protein
VSLVQKQRESKEKKKQKQNEKEEWERNHPWKPWDREKDLTAGRQKVTVDPENMSQGLSSCFASGAVQRNFEQFGVDDQILVLCGGTSYEQFGVIILSFCILCVKRNYPWKPVYYPWKPVSKHGLTD